ncbi:ribonuclease J [Tindallia californiensis]|uniref:Ribonuclease J n=1 Tax=Tindallia californiensis TaxID=159292 RepID=A0A1H3NH45_9FIRM|nr:ribonuclease J [Tindallia californiensis]SDY88168.1 ribonuclease J [Tindallia californiensis]
MAKNQSKIKIIPLGGLREIGKNLTLVEYKNEILIIDCGLSFPDDEMLGIDIVLPDTTYLEKNKDRIKGVVLTHGHEDHIGALPYLLKKINLPIYGTRLTLGLLEAKLKEHKLEQKVHLQRVKAGDMFQLGAFNVEFIRSSHSIPDACAIAVHTSEGIILHTGDFRIDYSTVDGEMIDLHRLGELGKQGVLVMLADSTNAERPGTTMSESKIGVALENAFMNTKSRIIVATFASHIHRLQQIINTAEKFNRKIVISGRSMINVFEVGAELGALHVPKDILIDIREMDDYQDDQLLLLTTGSQGEPMAALSRMASNDHRKLDIQKGDLVIFSASPIPGNEKMVSRVINQLFEKGADVIYDPMAEVHTSGHACQEELKLIHRLVNPKYFIPVHGEYRHLKQHANLAARMGVPEENIFTMENGQVLEMNQKQAKITGKVQAGPVLVDGLGVGDVGSIVLRDRKHLAEDGLMVVVVTLDKKEAKVVAGPDIISRGFVYVRESEDLLGEARAEVQKSLEQCEQKGIREWSQLKNAIRDSLKDFLYQKTQRRPMILPIIMEV